MRKRRWESNSNVVNNCKKRYFIIVDLISVEILTLDKYHFRHTGRLSDHLCEQSRRHSTPFNFTEGIICTMYRGNHMYHVVVSM